MDFTAGASRSRRETAVTFSGRDIVQFDVYIFLKFLLFRDLSENFMLVSTKFSVNFI
jgi:hypothetical protein